VAAVDDAGSGTINFIEFVRLLAGARTGVNLSALNQISELREAFAMYDTDGSGSLDVGEIQEATRYLGTERPNPNPNRNPNPNWRHCDS